MYLKIVKAIQVIVGILFLLLIAKYLIISKDTIDEKVINTVYSIIFTGATFLLVKALLTTLRKIVLINPKFLSIGVIVLGMSAISQASIGLYTLKVDNIWLLAMTIGGFIQFLSFFKKNS